MDQITTIVPTLSGLARWSEAPTISSTGYFCHPLGRGRRILKSRTFLAPAPRRVEPCPMPHLFGHFHTMVGILPLPKWESSAVRFGPLALPSMVRPRHHRFRIRCTVSLGSVVRSRRRADQAATKRRGRRDRKLVWEGPAVEPVDFLDQWDMFFDENSRTRRGSTRSGSTKRCATSSPSLSIGVSIPLRNSTPSRLGTRGSSQTISLTSWGTPAPKRARERREYDMRMWPAITEPAGSGKYDLKIRRLTLQEVEFGFEMTTSLANLV